MNHTAAKSVKRQPQRSVMRKELPGDTYWPHYIEPKHSGPICAFHGVVGFVTTVWAHQFVIGKHQATALPTAP